MVLQVESALAKHGSVAAAVVVGIPHPRWGEMVSAVVILKPGTLWTGPSLPCDYFAASLPPISCQGSTKETTFHPHHAAQQDGAGPVLTPGDLMQWCRHVAGLSPYKLPRFIAAIVQPDASVPATQLLPLNASGKVLKDRVKQALDEAQQQQQGNTQVLLGNVPERCSRL